MQTIFFLTSQGGNGATGREKNNIQTICGHPKNEKAAIGKAIFTQAPSPVQTRPDQTRTVGIVVPAIRLLQWLTTSYMDNKKWGRREREQGGHCQEMSGEMHSKVENRTIRMKMLTRNRKEEQKLPSRGKWGGREQWESNRNRNRNMCDVDH